MTVLFADIAGSTALVEQLDPEAAAAVIDPALRSMIEAVERYDGVVGNRGDGIMAIFGAPLVAEDHVMRACLAALAIRDALRPVSLEAGGVVGSRESGVRARIGIHTGDVVFRPLRVGRSWTQDAVGAAVNTAARLEQSAAPGTICMSATAWQLVRGAVTAAALPPVSMKGLPEPVARYELLDVEQAERSWGMRTARGLSAFVDRDRERATLHQTLVESLDTAERGGRLRMVQVLGTAGLGKSRLVHEFLGTAAARSCHVIRLNGDRNRRSEPFHPIATWLRGLLGIHRNDDPAAARRTLASRLSLIDPAGGVVANQLERLLGLADAAPRPDRGAASVDFGPVIATLFSAPAEGRRIIVAAENADGFDTATRELLNSALSWLARADVMVVSTGRVRMRFAAVPTAVTRTLHLEPLSDDDASLILAQLDAKLAPKGPLAEEILRKAGGNPLFLEEVAPALAARAATKAGSRGVPFGDDGMDDIPDRIEALLADRLSGLPRPLRALVQLCAVVGTDVPVRLLSALTGAPEAALREQLLKLQSEGIMFENGQFPDHQFTFKHALTRDVAYRTLLAARRRAEHARFLAVLEQDGERAIERHADDLALHAVRAQLWPQAVRYLQAAAEKAEGRTAHSVARAYLQQALTIVAAMPDDDGNARLRLTLLMRLVELARYANDYPVMLPILDEVAQLAGRLGDGQQQTRAMIRRIHVFNVLGRLDDAAALGILAEHVAARSGDRDLVSLAAIYVGQSHFIAGRLREAERKCSAVLPGANVDVAKAEGTQTDIVPRLLVTRLMARGFLCDFGGAERDVSATHALAQTYGRPYDLIVADAAEAFLKLQRRDLAGARDASRIALALGERTEIHQLDPPLLSILGNTLLMDADLSEASRVLNAALGVSRDASRMNYQAAANTGLAFSSLRQGQPDLALWFADQAVEVTNRHGIRAFGVQALRMRGLVLAMTAGREDEGIAELERAAGRAAELEMPADVAHAHAALALAGRRGDLGIAGRRYAALGMAGWFETVQAVIAAGGMPLL